MWLTDAQSKFSLPFALSSKAQLHVRLNASTEIGVALTTFGGLFMLLGVMLFFDAALLALGNVRLLPFNTSFYVLNAGPT